MKSRRSKLDPFAADLRQWFGNEKVTLAEAKARLAKCGLSVGTASLSSWWQDDQKRRIAERRASSLGAISADCAAAIASIFASCASPHDAEALLLEARRHLELEIGRLSGQLSPSIVAG